MNDQSQPPQFFKLFGTGKRKWIFVDISILGEWPQLSTQPASDIMRFRIATALCLLSTHIFSEQMLFRCHGYSLGIGDTSKQPVIFTVAIDRGRSLVVDIGTGDGGMPPDTSNGSIVEKLNSQKR